MPAVFVRNVKAVVLIAVLAGAEASHIQQHVAVSSFLTVKSGGMVGRADASLQHQMRLFTKPAGATLERADQELGTTVTNPNVRTQADGPMIFKETFATDLTLDRQAKRAGEQVEVIQINQGLQDMARTVSDQMLVMLANLTCSLHAEHAAEQMEAMMADPHNTLQPKHIAEQIKSKNVDSNRHHLLSVQAKGFVERMDATNANCIDRAQRISSHREVTKPNPGPQELAAQQVGLQGQATLFDQHLLEISKHIFEQMKMIAANLSMQMDGMVLGQSIWKQPEVVTELIASKKANPRSLPLARCLAEQFGFTMCDPRSQDHTKLAAGEMALMKAELHVQEKPKRAAKQANAMTTKSKLQEHVDSLIDPAVSWKVDGLQDWALKVKRFSGDLDQTALGKPVLDADDSAFEVTAAERERRRNWRGQIENWIRRTLPEATMNTAPCPDSRICLVKKCRLRKDWNNDREPKNPGVNSQENLFNGLFGVSFGMLGAQLRQHGVARFLLLFLSFYETWAPWIEYATRFNDDDYLHRLFWTLHGAGLLLLIRYSDWGPETRIHKRHFARFSIVQGLMSLLLVVAYARPYVFLPRCRPMLRFLLVGCIFQSLMWFLGAYFGFGFGWALRWVGALGHPITIMAIVLFLRKADFIPISVEYHLAKYRTVGTICFGSILVNIATHTDPHDNSEWYLGAFLGFSVLLCMDWLRGDTEFVASDHHAIRQCRASAITWIMLQPELLGSATAVGGAIGGMLTDLQYSPLYRARHCCWSVAISLLVFACLKLTHAVDSPRHARVKSLIMILSAAVCAAVPHALPLRTVRGSDVILAKEILSWLLALLAANIAVSLVIAHFQIAAQDTVNKDKQVLHLEALPES